MKVRCILIISCMCVLCSTLAADEIFTGDGKRYEGRITGETEATLTLLTAEGSMFINKESITHIERTAGAVTQNAAGENKKNILQRIIEPVMSLPKNNWFAVRVQLNKIHNRIFFILGKNPVYQFIEARPVIQAFRRDNYRCYYFAVYMVLFILAVMVVTVIRNSIMAIMRRVLGIKQRYDI